MLLYWCSEGDADLVQSWWVDEDGARDWSAVPLGAEVVWSSVPRRWSQPSVGCTESRSHVGHGRATEVARRWSTQSAEATCRVWSVCFWKILLTLLPRLVGSLSEETVDTFAAFGWFAFWKKCWHFCRVWFAFLSRFTRHLYLMSAVAARPLCN